MKYISNEAVLCAVRELKAATHPFLGITFLACKKEKLPVGATVRMRLDALANLHLRNHHRLDPASFFFFQPFKSETNWVPQNYAATGLQAINTQTFGSVFLHERGKSKWGFERDYVARMKSINRRLGFMRIPLEAIAIWTCKDIRWPDHTLPDDLIHKFLLDYRITPNEKRELFAKQSSSAFETSWLQSKMPDRTPLAHSVEPPPDADDLEGKLTSIRTKQVGPADELRIDLGERLTVIGGDNALGKSFLLDIAWWAATGSWAGRPATPFGRQDASTALIEYDLKTDDGIRTCFSLFDSPTQSWVPQSEHPHVPSFYVYARVDGAFSVADDRRDLTNTATMNFTSKEVWDGKARRTEGLIRDWVSWQTSVDWEISLLEEVLQCLSPSDLGPLKLSKPMRLAGDSRMIPVISHPYGDVPVTSVSAGVRRVLAIAYMIVWAWREHRWASEQLGTEPVRRVILLIDEIEAHLHPFWKRTILPAILKVGDILGNHVEMQTVVTTHSAFVLASLETHFRTKSDELYHLKLKGTSVVVEPMNFAKWGEVSSWLTSPMVGLRYARSMEAEQAIERAKKVQFSRKPKRRDVEEASHQLTKVLPPDDPFWHRWTYFAAQAGVEL